MTSLIPGKATKTKASKTLERADTVEHDGWIRGGVILCNRWGTFAQKTAINLKNRCSSKPANPSAA